MTITQTVEIPPNHRIILEVPREVPTGPVVISFAPATENNACVRGECPLYAENPPFNADVKAAIAEGNAIFSDISHSYKFEIKN